MKTFQDRRFGITDKSAPVSAKRLLFNSIRVLDEEAFTLVFHCFVCTEKALLNSLLMKSDSVTKIHGGFALDQAFTQILIAKKLVYIISLTIQLY